MKRLAFLLLLGSLATPLCAEDTEATITSDELELQKNGDVTIFRGHVKMNQVPYEVQADVMTRLKATGNVKATGHVVGLWTSAKNERVRVEGEQALYEPAKETVEIWGKKQVAVYLWGVKDEALFHGDRGWISTKTPGKAKLLGNVRGHVIPG